MSLKPLWDWLKRGRCVAFIGAGFSMACGMPNWVQLIERLFSFARERAGDSEAAELDSIQEAINNRDLTMAAARLKGMLSEAEIAEFMQDQFSRRKQFERIPEDKQRRMQARIDALVAAPWAGVITTNFDDLIPTSSFQWIVNGDEPHLGHVLARAESFYVRLHSAGWHTELVLTEEDYVQAYLDGGRVKTLQPFLRALMLTHVLVFIGCSLESRILDLRRELKQIFSNKLPIAYALLADTPANRRRSADLLKNYDIRCYLYALEPGGNPDHKGVDLFLQQLATHEIADPSIEGFVVRAKT